MSTPTCPSCQNDVDPGAQFCKHCGVTLAAPAAPAEADDTPRRRAPRRDGAAPARQGFSPMQLALGVIAGAAVAGIVVYGALDKKGGDPAMLPPMGGDAHNHADPMGGQAPGGNPADLPPAGTIYISGMVTLDPQAKAAAPDGGVLYIMARPAANPQGPPLAAVRLPASPEGIPFAIGPQDMMMGGALTEPVQLSARWDQDGDAMTRQAGDLVGMVTEPIQPGNMGVKIVLAGVLRDSTDLNTGAAPGGGQAPDSAPASAPDSAPAVEVPAEAPAGQDIQGTLQFAPDMIPANPERGTLYIIARRADAAVGPPLAVVRLQGAAGPLPFTIGPANIMAGGTFDQPVLLTARWDEDGNAMTKGPNDVEGTTAANPVAPGTRDIILILDKRSAAR